MSSDVFVAFITSRQQTQTIAPTLFTSKQRRKTKGSLVNTNAFQRNYVAISRVDSISRYSNFLWKCIFWFGLTSLYRVGMGSLALINPPIE